jgi:acetyl-CoA carboxylase carboxyltransferase component
MGAKGAVEVLEGRNIRKIDDAEEKSEYIKEKEDEYTHRFANPYQAAKYGFIDDVIEPRNTRFRIIRALELLANKKEVNPPKKHSNIPL